MWRNALVVWLLLLVVAVLNGALREAVLTPVFGAPSAHVLSTLLLSALVLAWQRRPPVGLAPGTMLKPSGWGRCGRA